MPLGKLRTDGKARSRMASKIFQESERVFKVQILNFKIPKRPKRRMVLLSKTEGPSTKAPVTMKIKKR